MTWAWLDQPDHIRVASDRTWASFALMWASFDQHRAASDSLLVPLDRAISTEVGVRRTACDRRSTKLHRSWLQSARVRSKTTWSGSDTVSNVLPTPPQHVIYSHWRPGDHTARPNSSKPNRKESERRRRIRLSTVVGFVAELHERKNCRLLDLLGLDGWSE